MISQIGVFEISPIKKSDAWKLCDFMLANADRLKLYFPKTLEQNLNPTLSQFFVEKKVKQFKNEEEFLFTLKQSKTRNIVGLAYIKEINLPIKQGEFAYCIGYQFERQGLASNMIKELSKYAFYTLELKTLQIIVHKSNFGSVKVAKNNNYIWVKTLAKEFTPTNEAPIDMELYELYKQ